MGHLYQSCVKLREGMIRRSDPVGDFLGRHEVVCAQVFQIWGHLTWENSYSQLTGVNIMCTLSYIHQQSGT